MVHCRQGKRLLHAHLPNPGRLQELLLPDCRLLLVPGTGKDRKLPCTVVGVEKADRIIMLDTLRTNAAARGTRHLMELSGLRKEGQKGAVLFLVHGGPRVRYFKLIT